MRARPVYSLQMYEEFNAVWYEQPLEKNIILEV